MKLKDYVDNSILYYPSLYRAHNYEDSRLLVLDHIFLTIGNGLEWHKDGFITELGYRGKYNTKYKAKKIPENFFSDDLWELHLLKEHLKEVKKLLKGYYSYILRNGHTKITLAFLCNDMSLVNSIFLKYDIKTSMEICLEKFLKENQIEKTRTPRKFQVNKEEEHTPYPMCHYSAIVEMINRKTESLHITNFGLVNIQPDYIEGALDAAKRALRFYKDPEKNKLDHYHPSKSLKGFKEFYETDPEKFRRERVKDGMLPEHTIEQWCQICWEKHLVEQIGYCEKLIEMYGK